MFFLRSKRPSGVKENLVLHCRDWPGVQCIDALTEGKPLEGIWHDRTLEYEASRRGKEVDSCLLGCYLLGCFGVPPYLLGCHPNGAFGVLLLGCHPNRSLLFTAIYVQHPGPQCSVSEIFLLETQDWRPISRLYKYGTPLQTCPPGWNLLRDHHAYRAQPIPVAHR